MFAILIILTLFGTVAVLAARYGRDSRETITSKEAQLAIYGLTWHGRGHDPLDEELAGELQRARSERAGAARTVSQGRSRQPAQAGRTSALPGVMLDVAR